jgi:hypothetical protein
MSPVPCVPGRRHVPAPPRPTATRPASYVGAIPRPGKQILGFTGQPCGLPLDRGKDRSLLPVSSGISHIEV